MPVFSLLKKQQQTNIPNICVLCNLSICQCHLHLEVDGLAQKANTSKLEVST